MPPSPRTGKDMVEIIDTYNSDGFLVKKTANGVPMHIPKEFAPRVQFMGIAPKWAMTKTMMAKEEFDKLYK